MKFHFAYGSNMWHEQMKNRCPNHRRIGNGVLREYRWIISKRGYANIVESKSDYVDGVIYEITKSDERSLDFYEGVHNGAYRKEVVTVEVDGRNLDCLVYIDSVEEEGKPKREYVERINKGIFDSKLSPEYVDRYVRRFIAA